MNHEDYGVQVGTIIASNSPPSPSTQHVEFVLKTEDIKVVRGEIVEIFSDGRRVLASVEDIHKTNAYYTSADITKHTPTNQTLFPTEEWEVSIANCVALGEIIHSTDSSQRQIRKVQYPVSPGSIVRKAVKESLRLFFGFSTHGINLGSIYPSNVHVTLDLTNLFRKHLAILAISGAGKSYATSVMIEEILKRKKEEGRLPVVIIDPHGEYGDFAKIKAFEDQVNVIRSSYFAIDTTNLNAWNFQEFVPMMSSVQVRELQPIIDELKEQGSAYDIRDMIQAVQTTDQMHKNTKESLISWLIQLDRTHLFSNIGNPNLKNIVKPGKLIIFDLSDTYGFRKKQIITSYIARSLFNLRRNKKIAPFLLIIEEAHNFCPENVKSISKSIIETIAREGRKFFASLCLISQRPVRLSATALSQCNSHLILKIMNPYDLDWIGRQSEGITKNTLKFLPDLDVGEAILVGEAVNYPVQFKIRKKDFKSQSDDFSLQDMLTRFED